MSQRVALYRRHLDNSVTDTAANIRGQHDWPDHRRPNGTWPRVQGDGRKCSAPMKDAKAQRLANAVVRRYK